MVNTRRITLGAISTNRRQSLAGFNDGPAATKPSTRTRTQRMSMAPRMVGSSLPSSSSDRHSLTPGRRKSVGESHRMSSIPPPMTIRSDTRPIHEKAYFNSCIKKLFQYLNQNGYEHPIKLKDLAKPSGKDFHSIMTFLMKKIDPNFNSSIKRKFEDDVVTAFKILGYPFNISKTALVAAGSPHTWPTLLLALTWLIEVLEGHPGFDILNDDSDDLSNVGEAGVPFVDAETLENRSEKAFLKYVEISYNSFLSGDDDLSEKLEVDLLQYFEKDNIMIEREIEKIVDDNNMVEEEILQIKKAGEDLPQRQKTLEELANDIEKFETLIAQLTEHKAALMQKVQDFSLQLKEKEDELERKEAKVNHLRKVVETQEYSKEDIQKLEIEKADMYEKIKQTTKMKENMEDSTLQKALILKGMYDELQKTAEAFNNKISAMFSNEKEASSFMISVKKEFAHSNEQVVFLGGVDIKGFLRPLWTEEKQLLERKTSQMQREVFDLNEKKEEGDEAVTELQRDIEMITSQTKRATETKQLEKSDQDSLLRGKLDDLNILREKVLILQDHESLERSLVQYREEMHELEKKRKEFQDAAHLTRQAVLKEFNEFIDFCRAFKDFQDKAFKELVDYVKCQDPLMIVLSPNEEELLESM